MARTKQNISQSFIFFLKISKWTGYGFDLSNSKIGNQHNTVLCELHFEETYMIRGGKSNLKWPMNTIWKKSHNKLFKIPSSLLPTSKAKQKPPSERSISNGHMDTFCKRDTITSLHDLNKTIYPRLFSVQMNLKMKYEKSNNHPLFIIWYLTKRQSFPKSIKIDSNLHFHLQYNGILVPLP